MIEEEEIDKKDGVLRRSLRRLLEGSGEQVTQTMMILRRYLSGIEIYCFHWLGGRGSERNQEYILQAITQKR